MTVRVEAAVFFRVVDPGQGRGRDPRLPARRAANRADDAARDAGPARLDDLLANQAAINELLKQIIDAGTEPWGVSVVKVETKDVDLPDR